MSFEHNIDGCVSSSDRKDLQLHVDRGATCLERLRVARADGTMPVLTIPADDDARSALAPTAQCFRDDFDDVVVLGMGGASMGGQAILGLLPGSERKAGPEVHFADNIDPAIMAALLERLDWPRTGVIAISKSGNTAETISQFLIVLSALGKSQGSVHYPHHCLVVTSPGDSVLRRLAEKHNIPLLDHDPDLGGRFSVFSLVGLLPALIAGLDIEALCAGAVDVLDATLAEGVTEPEALVGAALNVALAERGFGVNVLWPYSDRLRLFGDWYRQLWAESLGKEGKGTLPVTSRGAADQHSQLQLYLDGPADKMFTFILPDTEGQGPEIETMLADDAALEYLQGHRLGDLKAAEARATADILKAKGCPVREFRFPRLDERALGALLMHFVLETLIAADLLGIDPFGQPAVEEGKERARAALSTRAK